MVIDRQQIAQYIIISERFWYCIDIIALDVEREVGGGRMEFKFDHQKKKKKKISPSQRFSLRYFVKKKRKKKLASYTHRLKSSSCFLLI